MTGVLFAVAFIAMVYAVGRLAERRGRRSWPWMSLGACISPVLALVVLLVVSRQPRPLVEAPEPAPPPVQVAQRGSWRRELGKSAVWGGVVVGGLVIFALLSHGSPALSPPRSDEEQVAGLVSKTVEEELRKDLAYGVDPAATHVTADCNPIAPHGSTRRYTCFAYLKAPGASLVTQEWEGSIKGREIGVREIISTGLE